MPRIINVANRLPVTIRGENITPSSGGLVAAMEGVGEGNDLKWVGWPGTSSTSETKQLQLEKQLVKEFDYHPVFLSRNEVKHFYDGFSNSSLWPLLHYMMNHFRYEQQWWHGYKSVNERFADKVLDVAKKGDIVWVHDYHLMLLPQILRKRAPWIKIGFFLHTPFPSYELFRCHPHRNELLAGLTGADLAGFHTFGYMRHFRSSVMRLLGLETEMNCIKSEGGNCCIGTYPIGINTQAFHKELKSRKFDKKKDCFLKHFSGKKIILNVERLDYTKGIPNKLMAIDKFLEKSADRSNVCFVFVAVPSRDDVDEYKTLRDTVESQIGRINGKYSTLDNIPVHFIHNTVDFTELCALYSIADVTMVTPLMDGMNLVAKEYAMCKGDGNGSLILSEFAGAAQELFQSVMVNPYDIDGMALAIDEALTMETEEKKKRMQGMYNRVNEYDAQFWAKSFLDDLVKIPPRSTSPVSVHNVFDDIKERFAKAKNIIFFLDYDGTLSEFHNSPEKAFPTKGILDILAKIKNNPKIEGFVISGRKADNLSQWFGDTGLGLIAEHGFQIKYPDSPEWEKLADVYDYSWKTQVLDVLAQYSGTVAGSFVEEKASAIVWHYRRADPEFGKWKAKHLVNSLNEMKANLPVEVHEGAKIVEVSSMQISKGNAVRKLVEGKDYDLVVCIGDDYTDETMFRIKETRFLSIKVGKGETAADATAGSVGELRKLLTDILK